MKRVFPLIVLLLVPSPMAAAERRLSGTIVEVDPAAGTMVLETLGASRDEKPTLERHTVALGPDTKVELVQRANDGAPPWRRPYQASPFTITGLKPDDFVTVVGEMQEGRLRARTVTVVNPGS